MLWLALMSWDLLDPAALLLNATNALNQFT
jgi:hypothetical protein